MQQQINIQELKEDLAEIKQLVFERLKQTNPEGYNQLMKELKEEAQN
jgi:hypothetical protein